MLVLSRKPGERIVVGDGIEVQVLAVRAGRVRIGITCPKNVRVLRSELVEQPSRDWPTVSAAKPQKVVA